MTNFLTVKEAAKLTGKSPSSIRRIIYPILEDDTHPDRHHIEPDPTSARELRVKGESFAWRVSEELLKREVQHDAPKAKAEPKSSAIGDDQSAPIIGMLRKELDIKNRQIETQNDLLKGLSERLREGNILIGSLQQQLTLIEGARPKSTVVDAASPSNSSPAARAEKGSDDTNDSPKKRHWLFTKIF